MFLGLSNVMWSGILALTLLLITLGIAFIINYFRKPYLKYHKIAAAITFILVMVHAFFAFSSFLK
ncbi:MAG TPA: hypothetical protein P5277_02115 [Candidatus Paceibacterota bacterium]|nr:hypothetical protein [Candidatus Paceibacterota bacterium]